MNNRKITAVILCICLLLLTGCGNGAAGEENAGENSAVGMGRYVEDIRPFPEEINRNGGLNLLSDGSMTVISFGSGLYRSTDGGLSWQQEETDYFPMMQGVYAIAAVMAPDGTAAITCSGEMPQAAREMLSTELPADWQGNYCIFAFPDGSIKVTDFGFTQEDGSCFNMLAFREDGRLFAGDMNGKFYEVDMEHEKVKELFMTEGGIGSIGFCGDMLMVVGADGLYLYDLENQTPLPRDKVVDEFIREALADGTVHYTGGGYPLTVFGGMDGTIYIACVDGLYRHAPGGSVMEQVIDGALSTFGDDGLIYRAFALEDQEFLVQFNQAGGLARYHFDETIPAMPEREIKIYSLRENNTLRQAIAAYKKGNRDLYVRYETGLTGEDGMTAEDAVKRLNTKILSGEGPDVILLDGLPIDAYIEKGMLADLSDVILTLQGEDALFENLAESSRKEDGALYGLPLCIKVPVFVGDMSVINEIEDLESFADAMEAMREEYPEGGLLGIYDAETLLHLFSMVSSDAWIGGDGTIDRESVAEFLTQVKRICDAERSGTSEAEREALQAEDEALASYGVDAVEHKMEVCNTVLNIRRGYARLACGYVDGIQLCLDNVTSVIELEEGMGYRSFCGQSRNVFMPQAMVGLSANAGNAEDAKAFIRSMFSLGAQENVRDGFPVNRAAFAGEFDLYAPHEGNGIMTFPKKDGTEEELELFWPDEKQEQAFTELVKNLETPVITNRRISEAVYEEGLKVLENERSVEDAVEEIVKKAALYLAE